MYWYSYTLHLVYLWMKQEPLVVYTSGFTIIWHALQNLSKKNMKENSKELKKFVSIPLPWSVKTGFPPARRRIGLLLETGKACPNISESMMPFKLLGPSNKLRQQSVIFLDLNNNHTNRHGLHRSMLKKILSKII